jgi:hypothetical protein
MSTQGETAETYNPWTVVNVVFHHLAGEGLHPILGEAGDPGKPAADLLRALGVIPAAEGSHHVAARKANELAELRAAFEVSQAESSTASDPMSDPDDKPLPKEGCR